MRAVAHGPRAAPAPGGADQAKQLGRGGPAPARRAPRSSGHRRTSRSAWDAGDVVSLPSQPRRLGCGIDPGMGELWGLVAQRPDAVSRTAPGARAMLAYLGRRGPDHRGRSGRAARHEQRARRPPTSATSWRATPRPPPTTRCTRPAGPSTSPPLRLAPPGSGLPVHARPPLDREPDRLGARAGRHPRDRVRRRRGRSRTGLSACSAGGSVRPRTGTGEDWMIDVVICP